MSPVTNKDLLRVSTLKKQQLADLREGAALVRRTQSTMDALVARATLSRLELASHHLRHASALAKPPRAQYRDAVSRGYYALYHAFRATVFFMNDGDDHEKHSVLHENLPKDFPNVDLWRNDLKAARLDRNRADYDPVPRSKSDGHLKSDAQRVLQKARSGLRACRAYLRSKGWKP